MRKYRFHLMVLFVMVLALCAEGAGTQLVQQVELTASDAAAGDSFGVVALSADGSIALIGASGKNSSTGAAYVFTRSGSTWTQLAELTASDGAAGDAFGASLALSADGNIALIGASGKNSSTGAAYVFTRSGSTWTQKAELTASDSGGVFGFGHSLALSADGSTALIGKPTTALDIARVYAFMRSGSTWTQQAILKGSQEIYQDDFGYSMALSSDGGTALIGAYNDLHGGTPAYVFTRSGSTWTEQATLSFPSLAGHEIFFGDSVALSADGNTALLGGPAVADPSAVYFFVRSGSTWTQQASLTAPAGIEGFEFGTSVALSADGSTALVQGPQSSLDNQHKVYVFTRSGTTWLQQQKLTAADGATNDSFGRSMALSSDGSLALIGSPSKNAVTGAAYVFAQITYLSDLPWVGTPVNGWGPVEKDMSNGERAAGDGHIITLNGVAYAKGLGVHANSTVTYDLGGKYSTFVSDIGVDDEAASAGSVIFQVWADGAKIYDSGLMTGSSATKTVHVDVTGKNQLQLIVTDGGNGNGNDHADWAGAYLVNASTPPATGNIYISDLAWVGTPANGWGPVEKDMSNGERAAGDGHTITLNGATYAKGLGVHANSTVTYNLGGKYSKFVSNIGVDDEAGSTGSVIFQVWADGVQIYDSGLMTGFSATKTVNVDVTGRNQLQLIVTDGGNGNGNDHADWAGAYLVSASTPPANANTYISDLAWVGTPANGWGPVEKDMSNGERAAGDGHTITLNGVGYAKGLGVHANSTVTYKLGGKYSAFVSDIGVDDEAGSTGSVVFQVWADDIKIYDSGLMTGFSATKTVNVDVTGRNQLQLIVTDSGNGNADDHADWAGAYLIGL